MNNNNTSPSESSMVYMSRAGSDSTREETVAELSRITERSRDDSTVDDGDNTRPKRSWWSRVVSFRLKRKRSEDERNVDQDLYMRTILESYSSSLSSNRLSSVYYKEHRSSTMRSPGRQAQTDEQGGIYVAQPETPTRGDEDLTGQTYAGEEDIVDDDSIMEDEDEKTKRRAQRRITQEAIRAKLQMKNQHRARTRKKMLIFGLCIGLTLTAFVAAAVMIANVGIKAREEAKIQRANVTNTTTPTRAPVVPTPIPNPFAGGNQSATNGSLGELTGRSAIDLINKKTKQPEPSSSAAERAYSYVHCLLMSLSLWMSLVVIGMHMTFRSFRTYSMPLVLELSCVQCGYWISSLLRVQFMSPTVDEKVSLAFCVAECFFNFGQISFTCAIAFNMYRSVVSYADVLVDVQSAKRRCRSYTINVMLLSLLASITLSMVGYRSSSQQSVDNFQPCLHPSCRLILYVFYPLLAFGFNFIFYIRFKRTIGGAYPMSATGRLNKVARSYLVLFFVCWGSLILMTAMNAPKSNVAPDVFYFTLQCIFDVLGVGTALITLTNFHRCRKAFDFGLSLKAIDPHSIEFEEPVRLLGEGTFAIVLKAKWHQRTLENSVARTVDVAVKTFKHTQFETLEEMKEEAYLASKLVHPCVMMTYGCYTIGNNLYIVSEYLGGGTLQDVIDSSTSIPYEQALRYAHMIAMGMKFLHGLPVPIIHRDLKPLNCIFDIDKSVLKIADFGESRLFRKDGMVTRDPNFFPSIDLTLQMTTNIGSACWAAPEILKDEAKSEYSLKVDVYSFGIICWQLYTCQVPYTDIPGSVLAVSEAVIGGRRPDIPSDCPTLFAKIMRRCWHEDPLRRPSFEDIEQLLEMEMSDAQRKCALGSSDATPTMASKRSARKLHIVTPTSH